MTIYALVDCNNFYASCERIFKPALEKKPIVVLSNNDGCIIARSNEAKALGIPMGAPFFQYRDFCKKNQVSVFSSNYELYGDMSQRVMDSLAQFCPDLEVYSIDEAFLRLDGFQHLDLAEYSAEIRRKIKMWLGIPVSVGIGPTKTLAKLANFKAKRLATTGVLDLRDVHLRQQIMTDFSIGDIWGIGRQLNIKLKNLGIHTAKQLADSDPKRLRQHFSVTLERTIRELNGISCLSLEKIQPKKNIIASRSFGKKVTDIQSLSEAISHHTARACKRLREQHSKAQGLYVFITTQFLNKNQPHYNKGILQNFLIPTCDSTVMIQAARTGLKKIYVPGYQYAKCGVILMNITSNSYQQDDLFIQNHSDQKRDTLMALMDQINEKIGTNSLFIAAEGIHKEWDARFNKKSPCYTTSWHDLLLI